MYGQILKSWRAAAGFLLATQAAFLARSHKPLMILMKLLAADILNALPIATIIISHDTPSLYFY